LAYREGPFLADGPMTEKGRAEKGRAGKGVIPAATTRIEAKSVGTPLSSD